MASRSAQLRRSNRRLHRPRGVALMMVIAVIAIASILGYVMLSTASLQNHAGSNQAKLLSADYLAESGLNIAMYYLQYPEQAPARNADGYWSGLNGEYTLPNGSPSTLTVTVAQAMDDSAPPKPVPWTYEIVTSASVGSVGDPSRRVTRTNGARVYVRSEYVMRPGAIVANNSLLMYGPITTSGDVYTPKTLGLKSGSQTPVVNGYGYSQNAMGAGFVPPSAGYQQISNTSPGAPIAPSNDFVNLYKAYQVEDRAYSASILDAVTSLLDGILGIITRQPTNENPGGVIYKNAPAGSPFVLNDNTTINGTLVVEGDLQIKGTNITINPEPGFPALIVTGNMEIFQSGKSLTANGVTYIGGQLKSNGTPLLPALSSTFTVNGGLIFGSPTVSPIPTTYNVKTQINYNAVKAKAPELSSVLRKPKGVSIVRWGLP